MTPRVVTIAVSIGLVATLLACVVGIIVLAVLGQGIPGTLENVTIGSLGAVAGLLARTGSDHPADNPPTQVTVVNEPGDAVPVAETG